MPVWLQPALTFIQWLGTALQPLVTYLMGRSAGKTAAKVETQAEVIKNHEATENHIIEELDRVSDRPRTDSDINGVFNRWKSQRPGGDDKKD